MNISVAQLLEFCPPSRLTLCIDRFHPPSARPQKPGPKTNPVPRLKPVRQDFSDRGDLKTALFTIDNIIGRTGCSASVPLPRLLSLIAEPILAAMLIVTFFARQPMSNSWPRSAWANSEASLDETIAAAKNSLANTFTWAGRFEIADATDRHHVLFKWPPDSTHT